MGGEFTVQAELNNGEQAQSMTRGTRGICDMRRTTLAGNQPPGCVLRLSDAHLLFTTLSISLCVCMKGAGKPPELSRSSLNEPLGYSLSWPHTRASLHPYFFLFLLVLPARLLADPASALLGRLASYCLRRISTSPGCVSLGRTSLDLRSRTTTKRYTLTASARFRSQH